MRIVDIRERTIPISRYSDPQISSDGLNTTVVAIITDIHRNGAPIVGFGFSSIGRYGQSGLIRDRFAPRLLAAHEDELVTKSGDNLDPFRAWDCMMNRIHIIFSHSADSLMGPRSKMDLSNLRKPLGSVSRRDLRCTMFSVRYSGTAKRSVYERINL